MLWVTTEPRSGGASHGAGDRTRTRRHLRARPRAHGRLLPRCHGHAGHQAELAPRHRVPQRGSAGRRPRNRLDARAAQRGRSAPDPADLDAGGDAQRSPRLPPASPRRGLSHRARGQPRERDRLLLPRSRGQPHRGLLADGPSELGARRQSHRHRAARRDGPGRGRSPLGAGSSRARRRPDERRAGEPGDRPLDRWPRAGAPKEETMAPRITRRSFLAGTGATVAFAGAPAFAQPKPVKIGLLTVKTGPLAAGGIQMEQGLTCFLKDRNYVLAGRKVELVVDDTGVNPEGPNSKTRELVERDNVDMILGRLAACELVAISDYAAQAKMPILSLAAAEDMTQRKPNPFFVRASATSAQGMHPLADYAAKELK